MSPSISLPGLKRAAPLIGLCILLYVILSVGVGRIASAFMHVNPYYLLPAVLFLPPYLLLQAHKWSRIMKSQGISLPFPYLLKVYLISIFWSALTPGRLGTFVRAKYVMDKAKKPAGECVSGIVLDKMLDLLSLFVLAFAGALALIGYLSGTVLYGVFLLFLLFCGACAFLLKRSLSRRLMKAIYGALVPARLKGDAKSAFGSFYGSLPGIRDMAAPFAYTIASWLSVHTVAYFIALSLGMDVPYYIFVTAFAIATIVSLVPVTVSGFGTREAALIALFVPFGAAPAAIVAMSILYFIITDLAPSAAGIALMGGSGRRKEEG